MPRIAALPLLALLLPLLLAPRGTSALSLPPQYVDGAVISPSSLSGSGSGSTTSLYVSLDRTHGSRPAEVVVNVALESNDPTSDEPTVVLAHRESVPPGALGFEVDTGSTLEAGSGSYTITAECADSSRCPDDERRVVVRGVRFAVAADSVATAASAEHRLQEEADAAAASPEQSGQSEPASPQDSPPRAVETPAAAVPAKAPTKAPTKVPTSAPTRAPVVAPVTSAPTLKPTRAPTDSPTKKPTLAPTRAPTEMPVTSAPTSKPTLPPTAKPTEMPTTKPTQNPTSTPTIDTSPAIRFSDHFGNDMVLQRAPSSSVVYGTLELDPGVVGAIRSGGNSTAEVDVTIQGSENHLQTHIIPATVSLSPSSPDIGTFRAALPPIESTSGGSAASYSIYARCKSGCPKVRGAVTAIHGVKFGDVWFCAGQNNMGLTMEYTFDRNSSKEAVRRGGYGNIRYRGVAVGNVNANADVDVPWRKPVDALDDGTFLKFSAACWYFAENLVNQLGVTAPPIGLVQVSYSSSRIEDWVDDDALGSCDGTLPRSLNQGAGLYGSAVEPFAGMTIKGWLWYQGASNMRGRFGNETSGYACLLPSLIRSWRKAWSLHPGTTSPDAPFGLVTLHPTGSLGMMDVGGMRLAQTGGYGVVPNPAMPNTFLAQAFDLGDPYTDTTCYDRGCCGAGLVFANKGMGPAPCVGQGCDICSSCKDYCDTLAKTNFFMGPNQPRAKKAVGERLAQAAAVSVYGKPGDSTGPTLAGCRVIGGGNSLVLHFQRKLLGGDRVIVQDYDRDFTMSKLEVLVDPEAFCLQRKEDSDHRITCVDDGSGNAILGSNEAADPEGRKWIAVDIDSAGPYDVIVNLTKSGGVAHGVRYAWEGSCCSGGPDPTKPCPIASCPLMGNASRLPANPFIAKILNGKCECIAPQKCGASIGLRAFSFHLRDIPVNQQTIVAGSCAGALLFLICCICVCRKWRGKEHDVEGYEMVNLTLVPGDDDKVDDNEVW